MEQDNKDQIKKWRVNKDTFIPINEMENEHILSAIGFSEKKIAQFKKACTKALSAQELFESKREELIQEVVDRGIKYPQTPQL